MNEAASPENWLPIEISRGRYEVSDRGRVRSSARILAHRLDGDGYPYVRLQIDGKRRGLMVHTLVLTAFVGPRPEGMMCRHLDGNPKNAALSNLQWGTKAENEADKVLHGTSNRGTRNGRAKLTPELVAQLRQLVANGLSKYAAARQFGVNSTTVLRIVRGQYWPEVAT